MSPAAGWQPDPAGRYALRYHDGTRWTEHVATGGIQQRDPQGLAAIGASAPPVVTLPGPVAATDPAAVAAAAGLGTTVHPAAPGGARRRSAAGYWIAGAIAVLAVLGAAALGIFRFVDTLQQPGDYARTTVPGRLTLTVDDPGDRIVYSEGLRLPLSALDVTVTGPDGADVPVRPYTADLTYDVSGHSGRAVGRFDAAQKGEYRVRARGSAVPGTEMAVGTDLFGDIIGIFIGPLLIFAIGIAVAVTILVLTIVGRRRT